MQGWQLPQNYEGPELRLGDSQLVADEFDDVVLGSRSFFVEYCPRDLLTTEGLDWLISSQPTASSFIVRTPADVALPNGWVIRMRFVRLAVEPKVARGGPETQWHVVETTEHDEVVREWLREAYTKGYEGHDASGALNAIVAEVMTNPLRRTLVALDELGEPIGHLTSIPIPADAIARSTQRVATEVVDVYAARDGQIGAVIDSLVRAAARVLPLPLQATVVHNDPIAANGILESLTVKGWSHCATDWLWTRPATPPIGRTYPPPPGAAAD